MSIACFCPICERKFRVDNSLAGMKIACPDCAEPIRVGPVPSELPKTKTPVAKSADTPHRVVLLWIGAVLAAVLIGGAVLAGVLLSRQPTEVAKEVDPQQASEKQASETSSVSNGGVPNPAVTPAVVASDSGTAPTSNSDLSAFIDAPPAAVEPAPPAVPAEVASAPTSADSVGEVVQVDPIKPVESVPVPAVPSDEVPKTPVETAPVEPMPAAAVADVNSQEPPTAASPQDVSQVVQVHAIFKKACYRCHGESGTNEGGMNYVMNLRRVREVLVTPGNSAASALMRRISTDDAQLKMPPSGEGPQLTQDEISQIREWIDQGAHLPATREGRPFLKDDWVVTTIHRDLMQAPERSRRFIRYFSLIPLYNAGVSEDELETYRLAFSKLINSLSWGRQIVIPHRVDEHGTILRVDTRDLNWGSEIWDQMIEVNPYPYHPEHELAEQVYEQCASQEPWVRVDWFVFKASRPPLYHQILRIPETEAQLEQIIHADSKVDIEQEKVVRAGFNRSGVSRNNRLIERHEISSGAYWKSYDFAGNTGRQNLFEYPDGPHASESFSHDGGELIFTLPNGLLGFMLTDHRGNRLDAGPTTIVSDPATHDRTVVNGLSCFSCHFAGFIPKSDEIRPLLDLNAKAFQNSDYLKAIYPGQEVLNKHYQADSAAYLQALKTLGIANTSRTGEPISSMSQRFQSEVSLTQAAAEFGMTNSEFIKCLETQEQLPRSLAVLRLNGGTLKRDAFTELYRESASQLRSARNTAVPMAAATSKVATVQVDSIPLGTARVTAIALSPVGNRLVATTDGNGLLLFDTKTGKSLGSAISTQPIGWRPALWVSPQGDRIVTRGQGGLLQVWEIQESGLMKPISEFPGNQASEFRADVQHLCFSADGSTLVSADGAGVVNCWSVGNQKLLRTVTIPTAVGTLSIWTSADGREVQVCDHQGMSSFSTRVVREPNRQPSSWRGPRSAAFSPNGKLLAVATVDSIQLFNTSNGQQVSALPVEFGSVSSVAFTDQGKTLLALSHRKVVGWRVADQHPLEIAGADSIGPFSQIAFAAQANLVCWVDAQGSNQSVKLRSATLPEKSVGPKPGAKVTWRAKDKAEAIEGSIWRPVTVLGVQPDGKVRIHWDGWSDNFDENVDPTRLRKPEKSDKK